MGLGDRDYTKRDKNGNIDYSNRATVKARDDFLNDSPQNSLDNEASSIKYCTYCKKELEAYYEREKVQKNRIQDGVVSSYFVNEVVKKYEAEQCSKCGELFCHECMDTVRDIDYGAMLNSLCPNCSKIITTENSDDLSSLKVKFEDIYECNHVYTDRNLKEYRTDCKIHEETCIYCGHKKQATEPSKIESGTVEPVKSNPHVKYCETCGNEIKSKAKIKNTTKSSINSGVVSSRSQKDFINAISKCSMCGGNYCHDCLTYQRDKNIHADLYLCDSCLREYRNSLAKKQTSHKKEQKVKSHKKSNIPYGTIFTVLVIISVASLIWFYGDDILPLFDFNENVINPPPSIIQLKAAGEPVVLINNESATNPTWDELIAFLKEDDTDRILYRDDSFVCSDFSERLHNNAEKAGIRAAFVTIDLYNDNDGHALNAFETTDKGLTYIDCTGSAVQLQELDSFDKIAYVEEGKEYGIVSIYYTNTPAYEFYDLRKDNVRLRGFYQSMGIVKKVNVHWEMI